MNKRKTDAIKIRFERDMYEDIEKLASDNDTSLSEVVRHLIKKGLNIHD